MKSIESLLLVREVEEQQDATALEAFNEVLSSMIPPHLN